jgi:hypothetical protein
MEEGKSIMGKAMYALMFVVAIEFALYFFAGAANPGNSLVTFLLNPTNMLSATFYVKIQSIITLLGAAGIIAGALSSRFDWAIYAGLSATMISFTMSIVKLWQFIYSQLGNAGVDTGGTIATVVCAPLFIAFIFIILDYPRGKD